MTTETKPRTIFETLADGLDASVDGRGWGLEHEKAKNLANAAPKMLEALQATQNLLVLMSSDFRPKVLSDLVDTAVALTKPIQTLVCCCCADVTRGRQWWNRDKGYGLCRKCGVNLPEKRGVLPGEMEDLYGVRGVHYDIPGEEC